MLLAVAVSGCSDAEHRHDPLHPALPTCDEIDSTALADALGVESVKEYPLSDDTLLCGSTGASVSIAVMRSETPRAPEFPPFEGLAGATGGIIGNNLIVRFEPFLIQIHTRANDAEALTSALDVIVHGLPECWEVAEVDDDVTCPA